MNKAATILIVIGILGTGLLIYRGFELKQRMENLNKQISIAELDLNSQSLKAIAETLEDGKWKWEGGSCNEAQYFLFDLKKGVMTLKADHSLVEENAGVRSEYNYKILSNWEDGFRSQIVGEDRLDKYGNPVKWDLILSNDTTFFWRRNDWSLGSGTKNNVKCPQ